MAKRSVFEEIIQLLNSARITYRLFEHEPVITSQDAAKIRGTDLVRGAKSLIFFADKRPILLVLAGNKKVDTKAVKAQLGLKDLRMATREEIEDFGVLVGGVPPIGLVLNLPTYLDQAFLANKTMDFNAGQREKSVEMKVSDFRRLINPTVLPFSA